jgi:hypothetical protein
MRQTVLYLLLACTLALAAEIGAEDPRGSSAALLSDAFQVAEAWRQAEGAKLYANMTDEDWDNATRWKHYATPDAPERTCAQPLPQQLVGDILGLSASLACPWR